MGVWALLYSGSLQHERDCVHFNSRLFKLLLSGVIKQQQYITRTALLVFRESIQNHNSQWQNLRLSASLRELGCLCVCVPVPAWHLLQTRTSAVGWALATASCPRLHQRLPAYLEHLQTDPEQTALKDTYLQSWPHLRVFMLQIWSTCTVWNIWKVTFRD